MNIIASQFSPAASRFKDPHVTADGQPRARVQLRSLRTVWFNTGTLCNLTCSHCYIESSPSNDRLAYLSRAEVADYLEEIRLHSLPVREIGITGGEPFLNPELADILQDCLAAGFQVLVLTNAMRPMLRAGERLLALQRAYPEQLTLRVSVDHYSRQRHQLERGKGSWAPMLRGLSWLSRHGFRLQVAGRMFPPDYAGGNGAAAESETDLRQGFANLFRQHGITLDAYNEQALVLFPEMQKQSQVPEITTACWDILDVSPDAMMCASARMVVKRRGAAAPQVVACTLLPHESGFAYGRSLRSSLTSVALNHPYCAQFCVLGGGSCSA